MCCGLDAVQRPNERLGVNGVQNVHQILRQRARLDLLLGGLKMQAVDAVVHLIRHFHVAERVVRQIRRVSDSQSRHNIALKPGAVQQLMSCLIDLTCQIDEADVLELLNLLPELLTIHDDGAVVSGDEGVAEALGGIDHFLAEHSIQNIVLNHMRPQGQEVAVSAVLLLEGAEAAHLADDALGDVWLNAVLDQLGGSLLAQILEDLLVGEDHPGVGGAVGPHLEVARLPGADVATNRIGKQHKRQLLMELPVGRRNAEQFAVLGPKCPEVDSCVLQSFHYEFLLVVVSSTLVNNDMMSELLLKILGTSILYHSFHK